MKKVVLLRILSVVLILLGVFGLYTFVFVSSVGIVKRILLIVIAAGILFTGISCLLNAKEKS